MTRSLFPCLLAGASLSVGAGGGLGEEIRWGGRSSPNMVSEARDLPADPANAKPVWELKLGTHQYSIPTIDRGRIYLGINDTGIDRPGYKPSRGGALLCVDQSTGKLIWQLASPRYVEGVKPPLHFDQ